MLKRALKETPEVVQETKNVLRERAYKKAYKKAYMRASIVSIVCNTLLHLKEGLFIFILVIIYN